MARTAITPQTVLKNTSAAVTFLAADATNGMEFVNDGNSQLLVQNGSGSPVTVTVHSVSDPFGRIGDLTPAVAAGALETVPEMDPLLFNQQVTDVGSVYVDFSSGTSVTVAVVRRG
jgi:hypothetical protein